MNIHTPSIPDEGMLYLVSWWLRQDEMETASLTILERNQATIDCMDRPSIGEDGKG